MSDKQDATNALETIVTLSEQVISIAKANIAKARAAQAALPEIVDPPERTQE